MQGKLFQTSLFVILFILVQTRRDKYNRILAYVYLMDGTFLDAQIIK